MDNIQPLSGLDIIKSTVFGVMVQSIFKAALNKTFFLQVSTVLFMCYVKS